MKLFFFGVFLLSACTAFYLPGVAPRDYAEGETVDVKVNKIDSVKTQLPYDYYSLGFCRPEPLVESSENIGEILSGDMIQNSKYEVMFLVLVFGRRADVDYFRLRYQLQ